MQELSDWLAGWLSFLGPAPVLQILAAVAGFLLLAVIVDVVAGLLLRHAFRQWPAQSGEQLVRAARQPVFSSILLLGLLIALSAFDLGEGVERRLDAIVDTLLILIWVVFGVRATGVILAGLGRRQPPPAFAQPTTATLMRNTMVVVLGLAGIYGILLAWDVNVTGLVASAGILGLALSFAAQDTLGNLIAGISILTDKPYGIGDYIVLDSGERGAVTHIGLRSTRLLTRDDVEVSIPNGVMGKAKIVNESGSPQRKYRLRVPISRGLWLRHRPGHGPDARHCECAPAGVPRSGAPDAAPPVRQFGARVRDAVLDRGPRQPRPGAARTELQPLPGLRAGGRRAGDPPAGNPPEGCDRALHRGGAAQLAEPYQGSFVPLL